MRFAWLAPGLVALAAAPACVRQIMPPVMPYEPPDERIVLFPSGSADVAPAEGYFALGFVTALLEAQPGYHALVIGYADSQGNPAYNRDLSFRRARAVRKVLIGHGIDARRILVGVPRDSEGANASQIRRRADVYVYDPVKDEASTRLGYEVDLRAE